MAALTVPLPRRNSELIVRSLGDHGPYVVKDPGTGAYYHLGEEEHFLLSEFDGLQDREGIRGSFAARFGQPLADEELKEFVDLAIERGFLQPANGFVLEPSEATPGRSGARSRTPLPDPDAAPLG